MAFLEGSSEEIQHFNNGTKKRLGMYLLPAVQSSSLVSRALALESLQRGLVDANREQSKDTVPFIAVRTQ